LRIFVLDVSLAFERDGLLRRDVVRFQLQFQLPRLWRKLRFEQRNRLVRIVVRCMHCADQFHSDVQWRAVRIQLLPRLR
jgi:hypothetical protein